MARILCVPDYTKRRFEVMSLKLIELSLRRQK